MNFIRFSGTVACFSVIIILLSLTISPISLWAKEDTVYLSLKKTAVSKDNVRSYVVKRGEHLLSIIREHAGVKDKDVYRTLKTVRLLNPQIKNINRIYPGQRLFLPGGNIGMKGRNLLPVKDRLSIIEQVVNQLGESITIKGTYYIPIPPAGQAAINCSKVPIVELEDGGRVLLDFSSQIPQDVRRIIESTWPNYTFVDSSNEIFTALEKIINKSDRYSLRKFGRYVKVGENPRIDILLDWLISDKRATDEKPSLHGFRFIKKSSELLPYSIKKYSEEKGLTITEIVAGSDVASAPDEKFPAPDLPPIDSSTNRGLVCSLLTALGYNPAKNAEIKIFDSTVHGFDMSVKADLFLETKGERIIINFKQLPQQFIDIFGKRGARIIFVSENEPPKAAVQKVLYALHIPCLSKEFKFSIPEGIHNPDAVIFLPAIKITEDKKSSYLTNIDIDPKIQGLLYKKWGVNLIRY